MLWKETGLLGLNITGLDLHENPLLSWMEGRGVQWDRGSLAWLAAVKSKEDFGYVG